MSKAKILLLGAAVVGLLLFSASAFASPRRKATKRPADLDGIPLDGRRLTDGEVAYLLAWAGWSGEDLEDAVRIVLGESGGNPQAINVNRGAKGKYKDSVDRGLWQFNNVAFPDLSEEAAFDVQLSTERAYKVWKKVGWKPWRAGATETHTKHKVGGKWVTDTALISRAKKAAATLAA